jgi:hypothetical protein
LPHSGFGTASHLTAGMASVLFVHVVSLKQDMSWRFMVAAPTDSTTPLPWSSASAVRCS